MFRILVLAVTSVSIAAAQQPLGEAQIHERVYAIVPMTGAGTYDDPRRPLLAPVKASADGVIAFRYEVSDDGRSALVEVLGRDRKALESLLNSGRADVKTFRAGRDRKEDIEAEFRKHKRDFDLQKFAAGGAK